MAIIISTQKILNPNGSAIINHLFFLPLVSPLVSGLLRGGGGLPRPPFLVVPGSEEAETDLSVDPRTGEIRARRTLDRERTAEYRLSAIHTGAASSSSSSSSLSVVVRVLDVNDNAPEFPVSGSAPLRVDIPENTPRGARRKLPTATDADADARIEYAIEEGNEDGKFDLGEKNTLVALAV